MTAVADRLRASFTGLAPQAGAPTGQCRRGGRYSSRACFTAVRLRPNTFESPPGGEVHLSQHCV
eukprot:8928449-Pyramimonas_sp.AAC.1